VCDDLTRLDLACRNNAPNTVEDARDIAFRGWNLMLKMQMRPDRILARFPAVFDVGAPFHYVAKEDLR
jgi:hypothetical protein